MHSINLRKVDYHGFATQQKFKNVLQIGGNIGAAKAVYDDAPGVYLLLATLAIGSTAYAYWKFEYGGYKGVYRPVDLLEALNREDNVFLVDIRPEEDLKEKGVLDLKRGARGKATHLPLVDVRTVLSVHFRPCLILAWRVR